MGTTHTLPAQEVDWNVSNFLAQLRAAGSSCDRHQNRTLIFEESTQDLCSGHLATALQLVKQMMRGAGINGAALAREGCRAFDVGTLQASVPLNLIQRWLGHARMTTTAI